MITPYGTNAGPWLTVVLFLPLVMATILQVVPGRETRLIKSMTVAGTVATGLVVAVLLLSFDADHGRTSLSAMRFEERHTWVAGIGTSYHLGLDGLSAWLLALNAGLFLLASLWVSTRDTDRIKLFCGLLLLTETATAGVLLSLDLLLFYVFWEAMLIPLYLWLASYGGPRRAAVTMKFVIYTVAGSLFMLLSIIYLYGQTSPAGGGHSFGFSDILAVAGRGGEPLGVSVSGWHFTTFTASQFAFLGFAVAFLIKIPLVPFHTWLPDLYESAPTAALIPFAGVVGKLGAFGFLRYCVTLFPEPVHTFQFFLAGLAVLSILYGAVMALGEDDIKRIVAYASVSHLGFVMLGIFSLNANGINGAVIQMVNHGIIIAALFLVVGIVESRTGTRDRRELAGLERRMPVLYVLFLVITLAGLGMPGMNSFVGEFTIMLGAFAASPVLAVLAGVGVVLAAWYMLRLHQGLMHEPTQPATEQVTDLRRGEAWILVPLVGLMVLLGVFPRPVGDIARQSVRDYVAASQVTADAGTAGLSCATAPAPGCQVP